MTDTIRLITEQAGLTRSTKLYINGNDIGVLYLTEDEYTVLGKVLDAGGRDNNVSVDVPQFELEEEIDVDVFDEYD